MWVRNRAHVEQLFNYGSAVRKAMYTTNAVESVNAKKVVKQNLDDYDTKRKASIGND